MPMFCCCCDGIMDAEVMGGNPGIPNPAGGMPDSPDPAMVMVPLTEAAIKAGFITAAEVAVDAHGGMGMGRLTLGGVALLFAALLMKACCSF